MVAGHGTEVLDQEAPRWLHAKLLTLVDIWITIFLSIFAVAFLQSPKFYVYICVYMISVRYKNLMSFVHESRMSSLGIMHIVVIHGCNTWY